LRWEDVEDIGVKLGIQVAPTIGKGNLQYAEDLCRNGFDSRLRKSAPEGLVIRPMVDLFTRRGERIITKLKLKDFQAEA